jgi:hypothetical protein
MKKLLITSLIVVMALGSSLVFADKPAEDTTGNGAPKAPKLFSMNIIGMDEPKGKDAPDPEALDGPNNGKRIFVPLNDKCSIYLTEGPFDVIDYDGTDGVAKFQLPDPNLDPYLIGGDMTGVDTMSDYSIFVRPLGKPGGWATITTCADLIESNIAYLLSGKFLSVMNKKISDPNTYASVEQVGQDVTLRTNGKNGKTTFTNVTAELTTIVFKIDVDTNDDGVGDLIEYVRVPIFDDIIENEYWEYDNNGLRILQVRFYDIGTDVSEDDGTWNNEP